GQQATRKFRRRDEFRDLPDVLRVIRALSAVAREGSQSSALLCVRAQSIHACGRARPLCTLLPDQLDFARGRRRMHGAVHGRRDPRVRSRARISRAARRAWGRHMRCWCLAMAVVSPDQSRIDELTDRVEWDTRIFEERRKTMNFVCEVPVLIEQRLFAL